MQRIAKPTTLLLPPILLLALFWGTSFVGLDFGVHWDESRAKFDSVRDSLKTGVFLQASGDLEIQSYEGKNYNYGGVNYLLTWSGFTPELLRFLRGDSWTREALSDAITPIIYTNAVRLRVRAIYVVVASLAILWLFCLNIVLGRSRLEAFLAAAILACSWELAYHSRWIAPDAVMMQFALLSFLCLALGMSRGKLHWLHAGAVALGLTIGTKYPGALALPLFLVGAGPHPLAAEALPVLPAGALRSTGGNCRVYFLLTNPGVLLDPFRFFAQLSEQGRLMRSDGTDTP